MKYKFAAMSLLIVLIQTVAVARSTPASANVCLPAPSAGGGFNKWAGTGTVGVATRQRCSAPVSHAPNKNGAGDKAAGIVVSSVDCGVITSGLTSTCFGASPCPAVKGKPVHTFQTVTRLPSGRDVISSACGVQAPALTLDDVRAQAVRIVPRPKILRAPPSSGIALVHVDVIFWIGTASRFQALPSAVLLGHQVEFRVAPKTTAWTCGDGQTATSVGAGRPYDLQRNPCRTAQCPGYFEHAYDTKGERTVTATATWRAQYRVDGGGWADLGTVPGRPVTVLIHIYAARSVLVEPGH